ncbi:XVIPCD domain-containing protein [Dyella koreensis]|uniref:Peptidoglycan-binding protein n=1 Tax=Dyella koreensis TaxID=311235 RepID=A0ABW8K6T8_9GAMM
MASITDNEARALIYFAIGVTSEGSDRSYQLAFAGNVRPDEHGAMKMHPKGNSGYTIGTLQTDLGQHKEAAGPLADAFQDWARAKHPDWVLTGAQRNQAVADLSRDGNDIKDQNGRPMDATVKAHLDRFLESDAGVSFVHQHDMAQTNRLMSRVVAPLRETTLFQQASIEDQEKMIAITAKAFNQNEVIGGGVLTRIKNGSYHSVTDVSGAIDHYPDYMQSGRNDALRGTQLFRDLQNTAPDHPLHQAWESVKADPLVNPTQLGNDSAHAQLPHEYAVMKDAFVDPAHARPMIQALSQGGSYAKTANGRGFYAEGQDLVVWDRAGNGHALVNGQWGQINSQDISIASNRDHTLDLNVKRDGVEERLLHVTHPAAARSTSAHSVAAGDHVQHPGTLREHDRGSEVGALQTKLGGLGYSDARGNPLVADNDFGSSTKVAVEAFQRDHGLKSDGIAGPATLKAIEEQTQALAQAKSSANQWQCPVRLDDSAHPDNAFYLKTRELVHQLDQQNGRTPDQRSDQLASALTVSGRASGLQRIDQIALSEDASALWGAQRPPGVRDHFFDQHCKVNTMQALNTSMEQSGAQWPQAMQQFQHQEQAQKQQQVQQQDQAMQQQAAQGAQITR